MKTCNTCKKEKELSEFTKSNKYEDKLSRQCKSCRSAYRKTLLDSEREYRRRYRKKNANRINEYKRQHRKKNLDKARAHMREKYRQNKDKFSIQHKKYYEKNKKKIVAQQKEYRTNRYNTDHNFKMIYNLRTRIRKAIKANGLIKDKQSFELLGADIQTIRNHIESQFEGWMTWENHGTHTWHIDHIVPLSSAKTLEEIYALCHYTNLQPLAAIDNIRKSNKIIAPPPHHAPE